MKPPEPYFVPPGTLARAINKVYGWLTALGIVPPYGYLLEVHGRTTGKIHSVPINLLRFGGNRYLIGTRGHTQWSRNALVAGRVILKRGRSRRVFELSLVSDEEKAKILKAYLTRFSWMVRRFFPVSADAPLSSFAAIAGRYPVFKVEPTDKAVG